MAGGPNGHKHPIDYEFSERDRNNLVYQFASATDAELDLAAELSGVPNPRLKREERREKEQKQSSAT